VARVEQLQAQQEMDLQAHQELEAVKPLVKLQAQEQEEQIQLETQLHLVKVKEVAKLVQVE
jgi:hypothetical protein